MIGAKEKSHILIVDDNPSSLLALEAILKDLNQNLVLVKSPKEALKKILKYEFAVIMLDAYMPDMNGFEVAQLIRSRDKSAHTPIIFMTALYKDELDVKKGYALGAVDYIFKPIDPLILRSKIKVFVDLFTKSLQMNALETELHKRLLAEKKLKVVIQRTQLILNSAAEGIIELNSKGIITFANPAAAKKLGRTINDMVGQSVNTILPNQISWKFTSLYLALQDNRPYHTDAAEFLCKDKATIPIEYTATPLQTTRANQRGIVVLFKNISDRKRAEALARQQQHQVQLANGTRITTMFEMASALAHELNQPLTTIANYTKGSIRRLESKATDKEELLSVMRKTAQQAERAGEIIHRIKNFVRKGTLYQEKVHINEVIKNAATLLEYETQETSLNIKFDLSKTLPLITVDKIQFEQVIINLIRNSIEALSAAKVKKPTITVSSHLPKKDIIEINIIDNGPGFVEDTLDKIFDAYFTTKPQGMGMGLSICRTIIEAHGGYLIAKSNPVGGAWLQFTLPITEG